MRFVPTELAGVFIVALDPQVDDRGSFTRVWSSSAFAAAGLRTKFPEHSVARNTRRGIIRGLHYQVPPNGETKVVRCTSGAIWDVLVDLRRTSATYGVWTAVELRAEAPLQLYVPEGIAHGYQTLTDASDVHYLISSPYVAQAARGIAWDSPRLAIPWPLQDPLLSERDRNHPPFTP